MKYKLVKLRPEHPIDAKLIEQGFMYRPVPCTTEEEVTLARINNLVNNSRQNLRALYSGTLNEEDFDTCLARLEENDEQIQQLATKVKGVEFNYLNPFHSGRGFIEE